MSFYFALNIKKLSYAKGVLKVSPFFFFGPAYFIIFDYYINLPIQEKLLYCAKNKVLPFYLFFLSPFFFYGDG